MPPGPAYNWYCVAHGVFDVLSRAAQIRATQAETQAARVLRRQTRPVHKIPPVSVEEATSAIVTPSVQRTATTFEPTIWDAPRSEEPLIPQQTENVVDEVIQPASLPVEPVASTSHIRIPMDDISPTNIQVAADTSLQSQRDELEVEPAMEPAPTVTEIAEAPLEQAINAPPARKLQSSKVPSSRIGRLFHYGGLAASLGYGAASELIRRSSGSSNDHSSLMMTEGNIKRLVSKLTQMRGAALKLGQFMSIQDSHVLPPEVEDIFRRVQDSAHYMPDWQMEQVMTASFGPTWTEHFASFDRVPFAAASIGQVHSAVLASSSSPTGKEEAVAVKIQFPNIVNSIESDLGYVKLLLTAGRLLPKGLFLDRTIQVMKDELADECDYSREASFLKRFGESSFLGNDPRFKVPWVWEGSTKHVLVMERVEGVSVGGQVIDSMSQRDRNEIASRIIDLCLKELFVFKAMQTDPNWTNFLWNGKTRQIELVDFGATREYSPEFIHNWLRLLQAAASDDRQACIDWSLKVGYLTGEENETMIDAHVKSMTLLASPFKATTAQPFAFGPGSRWADITAEIRAQIPVMLQYRLTPPPRETYSLNRKLSGAFLLAGRLNAEVDCKSLWDDVIKQYDARSPLQ